MGLPGSGKTTLAGKLKEYLEEHGTMSYSRALLMPNDFNCQDSVTVSLLMKNKQRMTLLLKKTQSKF
jgi:adenylate kinase family enzyme